ncbi:hypothetical protein [Oceanivirga miroungae]|uniref:Uncharacterized protein n=1 Tax=Oceanivirga miroungae TaxID=1130046 RepID=A0A6I8MCD2_9FUSO|nr:hypothetical protein [Oceanivirga miroungae]VWL85089.1 hypothetical protein OMES3154_00371 [Oceanivirga miroungae]
MKKVIMLLLALSSFGFAGIKEDIEEARNLYTQNNVEKAIEKLKSIEFEDKKGEDFELVNFSLFNLTNDVSYLESILEDKDSKGEYAILANEILANNEKDINKKLILQKELNKRTDNKNAGYLLDEAISLYILDNEEEANRINYFIDVEASLDIQKVYYQALTNRLYQNNLEKYAAKAANISLNLDKKDTSYIANIYILVATYQKNVESVIKYLGSALKLDESDSIKEKVAIVYANKKEYEKALDIYKELYNKTNNINYIPYLFAYSILNKDSKNEKAYYEILINSKEFNLKNKDLAVFLANFDVNLLDRAIIYGKKAVLENEEKSKEVLEEITKLKENSN